MVLAHLTGLLDGQLGPKKVKSAGLFMFMCGKAAVRLIKGICHEAARSFNPGILLGREFCWRMN